MAESKKIYTILKSSYMEEHEPFVTGLFYAQTSDEKELFNMIEKIINADDVKKVYKPWKASDENLFYVEYNQSFEEDFYHGYKVTFLDLQTSLNSVISTEACKSIRDEFDKYIEEIINKHNANV